MIKQDFKIYLLDMYKTIHQYGSTFLSGLKPEIYNWTPTNTKARSISSYFRHMVNTEIYWLYGLKSHDIPYIQKDMPFEEMIVKYKDMEQIYTRMLDEGTEEDLEIRETIYDDKSNGTNLEIKQHGTLAWTIFRISLHAYGHMSQMTHILFTLGAWGEGHPNYDSEAWWIMTEKIIALGNLAKN